MFEQLSQPVHCFSVNTKMLSIVLQPCAASQFFRSLGTNSFPLPDTTVNVIPNRDKIVRRHVTTSLVDQSVHGKVSSQPDPALAMIRKLPCYAS